MTGIKYKLTDANMCTYYGYTWQLGEERVASGEVTQLCTSGVFHFYDDPLLAVLLNPIHANFIKPRLFECEANNIVTSDGLKGGCKSMTLLREIALPVLSIEQCVTFGILCALKVYNDPRFQTWGLAWLDNSDRSRLSAEAAWVEASNARAVAEASAEEAWAAAEASTEASVAAAWAAEETAELRTLVAARTAAAVAAARAAEAVINKIDFIALAHQCVEAV